MASPPQQYCFKLARYVFMVFGLGSSWAQTPNILFILTDDQGWPTLGCYGGKKAPTPNLDRLADEGALLTSFYVTSQCSPTRATFLTGQYTARNRLWHVLPWYGYPWAKVSEPAFAENFPRETFTVAKGLRQAGYATAIVGKWHLTNNDDGNYMGLRPEAATYYGFDYAPPLLPSSEFDEGNDRGVDQLTDQAIGFIERNRDRPWFCYLSHHMIHGKVVAPDPLTNRFRKQGYGDEGPNRAVYLAGLAHIDASIGRLMAALDAMGEADDTLVVFTSDNGGVDEKFDFSRLLDPSSAGQPKLRIELREYDNAPLRMGKGSVYEGGVRVPFIVRWPGQIDPGQHIDTPAHVVDLAPTFLSVAGASATTNHPIDGESLVGLFAGEDTALAKRPIYQYYPFYDLRWGLTPSASIRIGDYKLIEFFGDRVSDDGKLSDGHSFELYNLKKDPGETSDLSKALPGMTRQLATELKRWLETVGAQVPTLNANFDPTRRLEETRQKQP